MYVVLEWRRGNKVGSSKKGEWSSPLSCFGRTCNLKWCCNSSLLFPVQCGTTPLHEACIWGAVEFIPLLLRHGKEANVFDTVSGSFPSSHEVCVGYIFAGGSSLEYPLPQQSCIFFLPEFMV